jgi:hypothetical protein
MFMIQLHTKFHTPKNSSLSNTKLTNNFRMTAMLLFTAYQNIPSPQNILMFFKDILPNVNRNNYVTTSWFRSNRLSTFFKGNKLGWNKWHAVAITVITDMSVFSGGQVPIHPHHFVSKCVMKFTGKAPVIHNRLVWKRNTVRKTLLGREVV